MSVKEMDCLICFRTIQGISISCADSACLARICAECASSLINYSIQNQIIPTCLSNNCKAYYLVSEIKQLSESDIVLYEQACLNYFVKEKGDVVTKQMEQKHILEKLREERRVFLQTSFPKAIATVAQIALKTKLHKLEKSKLSHISDKLKDAHRICINLCCNGHLDQNLVCMKCASKFCIKCEKLITDKHICNADDLHSIDLIKNIVQCPKCHIHIERSQGCNHMTCANCKTSFDYATGGLTDAGSNNAGIAVREKIRLSAEYATKLTPEQMIVLLQIEALEPEIHTDKTILTLLRHYYEDKDQAKQIARKLAKQIEITVKDHYTYRRFIACLTQIEKAIIQGTLTIEFLTEVMNNVK